MRVERTVDLDGVPSLGVADVLDRDVVVLAPEKRNRVEPLAIAEHVPSGHLTLALGDDPVFDADSRAGVGIGPSSDVAGGEHARRAGLEILVDGDAAIDASPACSASAVDGRTPTPTTMKSASSVAPPLSVTDLSGHRRHRLTEVKRHAVGFVQRLHESADLVAHHAFERHALGSDHVDGDVPSPKRGGDFESDETRADDHDVPRDPCALDDRAAVGERTEVEHP